MLKQNHHLSVYFISAVAALGGLLFGYDTGLISGAELFLRKDFALNPMMEELAVSAILIGGIFGSAVMAVAAIAFCWFLVPETKGKNLEQIEEYWEDGRHWQH